MKFNVSSEKLFQQLQAVSRVVANKSTLKILECILFDLSGNILTLTASDGETTIRTAIDVDNAEGEGKVAFGAKLLIDTMKEFPAQPLTFTIDDYTFGMIINSVNGKYSFVGVNGNEYPEMPKEEEGCHHITMQSKVLLNAINKTIFCTADDELRPVMNGINFDLTEDHITLVATDAHRLVRYNNYSIKSPEPVSFILPKKPANVLRTVLTKDEEEVEITFGQKNARFEFNRTLIICRQIEGRYPNYNGVIPQNNSNCVVIDRLNLLAACKRTAVFANNTTALLKLELTENNLTISAQDIDFSTSAEESIQCSYSGNPIAIGFKGTILSELLGNVDSSEVEIRLMDSTRAGLILPTENEENEDLLMLLMPMLLNE